VADAADDIADAAPRTAFQRARDIVLTPPRIAGRIALGVMRDPYTMTEISVYAVSIGGSMIRERVWPDAAVNSMLEMLDDPNSLDTPQGERRFMDAMNLVFARESTLVGYEAEGQPTRLASLDRNAGLTGDTGAGEEGEADNAITRARFIAVETAGATEGERREFYVPNTLHQINFQLRFTTLLQRYIADPTTEFTRSEAMAVQMGLARYGMGEADLSPAAVRRSLGEYVAASGENAASIEAKRLELLNERNGLSADQAVAPAYVPPPPAAAAPAQ
jgi:hypothetical protein